VKLFYDPEKSVLEQLREGLKRTNTRVLDLFREMDGDNDGRISKKDFRKAFLEMGPDFPSVVVEKLFDDFDPDGSGEIEFNELDKFLRRTTPAPSAPSSIKDVKSLGGGNKAKSLADAASVLKKKGKLVKSVAGLNKRGFELSSSSRQPHDVDPTDVEGAGRGEFSSNMKIRADDFFRADNDGNTELDYGEFCGMFKMRQQADGKEEPSESDLKALFTKLDQDSSGTVDLSEYVQWALREALRESKGRVLDLFREWDKDNSGAIDKKEFGQALEGMGFTCSKGDLNNIFTDLDPDGSGSLNYSELNSSLRKSLARKQQPAPKTGRKR